LGLSFATAAQQRGVLEDGPLSIVGNLAHFDQVSSGMTSLRPAIPSSSVDGQ
jgi:hypothetical protein